MKMSYETKGRLQIGQNAHSGKKLQKLESYANKRVTKKGKKKS